MNKLKATETTALAVKILRDTFKGVKFSGVTKNNSTHISWTDGPSYARVQSLVGHMHGMSFDMMTDMASPLKNQYGNRYIFFQRELSEEYLRKGLAKIQSMPYGVYVQSQLADMTLRGCSLGKNKWGGWEIQGGTQQDQDWGLHAIAIAMSQDEDQ